MIELPEPPKPGGAYEPVRVVGGMAYVAIQFPVRNGTWLHAGRLGAELTTEQGYAAARACALNVLAQLDRAIGLDAVTGMAHMDAWLQTAEGWNDFPRVVDGASETFLAALGDRGRHTRALAGVHRLPMDAPVAIVTSFALR